MRSRPATPHATVPLIVTGHFRHGPRYSTWRPAGTEDWLLIHTITGRGVFAHAGGEIITRPGEAVLLRPGTPHDYRADPIRRRWELLWAHFHPRPHWLPWLRWPEEAPGLMRLPLPEGAARRSAEAGLREMHRLAVGALARHDDWAMNALEAFLLTADQHNPLRRRARIDPRLQRAIDYACEHLDHELPLHRLARLSGLSLSRFAHLFREQLGATPQSFIERQRLTRAGQLLRTTSMTVQEIAYDVGFSNPFYFSMRFKRDHGMSPTQFRRHAAILTAHGPSDRQAGDHLRR